MDNFSDKFRQAAEEFSITPSEQLWARIEQDIKPEKKKRRVLLFLFYFLGLGLLTSGLFWLYRPKQALTAAQQNHTAPKAISQDAATTNAILPLKETIRAEQAIPVPNKPIVRPTLASTPLVNQNTVNKVRLSKPIESPVSATNPVTLDTTAKTPQQQAITTTSSPSNLQPTVPVVASPTTSTKEPATSSSIAPAIDTINKQIIKDTTRLAIINEPSISPPKVISTNSHRWSFGLLGGPGYSISKLEEQGDFQFVANYRNHTDQSLIGYNFLATVNYQVASPWSVYTGIGIHSIVQSLKNRQAVYKYDTVGLSTLPIRYPSIAYNTSFDAQSQDSTSTSTNRLTYLEIPFGVQYNFLAGKRFSISLQASGSINKLLSAEGYLYNYNSRNYVALENNDMRQWIWGIGGSVVLQYQLTNHFSIVLSPAYQTFLSSIYPASYPINQQVQCFSVRMGFLYRL